MKAIILAAGRGTRMGSLTQNLPKCRTVLHGKSLIEWQFESMRKAGIHEIGVVRGYLAETFDFDVEYFENPRWLETNMVMSLCAADEWLATNDCVVSYSDIVYSPDTVRRLIHEHDGDIVITYDPNWRQLWEMRFSDPLSDAETFKLKDNRVVEIGNKPHSFDEIQGQYMGLIKFSTKGWKQIKQYLSRKTAAEKDALDMTKLLQGMIADNYQVTAVPIEGKWYEVDCETDLITYQSLEKLF